MISKLDLCVIERAKQWMARAIASGESIPKDTVLELACMVDLLIEIAERCNARDLAVENLVFKEFEPRVVVFRDDPLQTHWVPIEEAREARMAVVRLQELLRCAASTPVR